MIVAISFLIIFAWIRTILQGKLWYNFYTDFRDSDITKTSLLKERNMAAVPSRFLIAKEKISVSKNDHVLEIGCGTGTLIQEISKELSSGKIVGIDKSKSAIEKATAKNKACMVDKKVKLINAELEHAKFLKKQFNKIVSFNVNIFLKNSELEFRMMKEILKPNGEIFVFYQFPFRIDIKAANPIIENFAWNGFKVTHKELLPASPTGIIFVRAIPDN